MPGAGGVDAEASIDQGVTHMSTVEQQPVLQQASDEQLARMYLELRRSGKSGSQMYERVEAEMRARGLIRQARVDTFYTGSNSRFDARPMLFAGSSFR